MADELTSEITTDEIRDWLLGYAWMGDADEKRRTVDCIMSQEGEIDIVSTRADRFAGAQFEPGPKAFSEGMGFALSAL